MDASLERTVKTLNERLDKLVPHGLGEEKVPPQQELMEYISTIANTPDPIQASVQWIDQTAAQYGYPRARTMYVEMVKRNEAAMAKLAESEPTTYSPEVTTNTATSLPAGTTVTPTDSMETSY